MPTSVLDSFFDASTMSVHLQQDQPVMKKKGKPGGVEMTIDTKRITKKAILQLITDIEQEISARDDAFVEIERPHSRVLQVGPYRIVLVMPPVANTIELTIVRPVAKLALADYNLDDRVVGRLLHDAQGVLIAGAPGEGKTTFAQALIGEIAKAGTTVIKTVESPRDLVVPDTVTQYSFSHAPHNEIRDILLLSRPDRTVYDEVRNKEDFHLYKDLRLTGIGLIGVMHATRAIDSLQRFIAAIDMGTLPQVIDTVVFIQAGRVEQILTLEQVVKVPTGMASADLARPIIHVHDYGNDELLYEVYSYGDTVVVMPLDKVKELASQKKSGIGPFANHALEEHLQDLLKCRVHVQAQDRNSITIYVPESAKGRIIGKSGARIDELQKALGLSISVRTNDELTPTKSTVPFEINEIVRGKKAKIELHLPPEYAHQDVKFMIGNELLQYTVNHKAIVTIRRNKHIELIQAGMIDMVD